MFEAVSEIVKISLKSSGHSFDLIIINFFVNLIIKEMKKTLRFQVSHYE